MMSRLSVACSIFLLLGLLASSSAMRERLFPAASRLSTTSSSGQLDLGLAEPPLRKLPWFCHDLDCPPYKLVDHAVAPDVQLRQYGPSQWITTLAVKAKFDQAVISGYYTLSEYFNGANEANLTIANLTEPVRAGAVSTGGPYAKGNVTVSFFLPFDIQGVAPEPTDPAVYLEHVAPRSYFVRVYPGYTYGSKILDMVLATYIALDNTTYAGSYDNKTFFSCTYDSPFALVGRHNEVWIPML